MSDASGQPPADGEEGTATDPEFRDDALSELMTGAFAATSMVAMGGEGDLPAPPVWSPVADAPKAEVLDPASGSPSQIQSGPHAAVEPEIEIDAEFEELDYAPVVARAAVTDGVVPRTSDAVTVPLSGPIVAGPLGPPSVEMPISSDAYPADIGYEDDEGEGAASISTNSGVVVTPQHAQGARLTGAYPTVSPHLRSPSPRREKSVMPWAIGSAVLVGLIAVGVTVMMGGEDTVPAANPTDAASEPTQAAIVPSPSDAPPEPEQPDAAVAPALKNPESEAPDLVDPSSGDAPPPAADDPKRTYAAALARYESAPTNPGLLELTLTACALKQGPQARTAFHKLIGGKLRSKAVVKCRESDVDVTSKVEGYTGLEIASQARAALEGGHAKEALALAKQSNRTERNHEALELMVLAHCKLKQKKSAKKMLRHVPEKRRRELINECKSSGVRLK